MDLGLKGKVVIVTGGARGIGAGICEVFAQEGANVVVNYRSKPVESEAFAKDLAEKYGVQTIAVQADMGEEENILQLFDETYKAFGTVDIVVNNANFMNDSNGPIETFDPKKFQVAERASIEAVMITSRELVKHCKEKGKAGHIVNVLSKSAFWSSSTNNTSYIAVKGANFTFTRGLAHEVAKDNIYVNAIIPGYVFNSRTDTTSDRFKRTLQYIPMKRYGTPLEMGYMTAFLCSDKACQCNGAIVDCTGGTMNGH